MRVTEAHVAAVPVGNLRVPRADFGALWAAAEQLCDDQGSRGVTDWYAAGVAVTCRWMAVTVVQDTTGRRRPAHAPVTRRTRRAYEELIEAEYLAAEQLDLRHPEWLAERPGWSEAVRATLRWAWRHSGPPPLQLTVDAAG